MKAKQFVASEFTASARLLDQLAGEISEPLARTGQLIGRRLSQGNKALIFGNGGSAADAQHLAAELVGRYRRERPALPAVALTTDTSLLTAVSNDFGFEQVFSRQVLALTKPGDVAIGISTSGRSTNVIAGLRSAQQCGAYTIALVGQEVAGVADVADEVISVPSPDGPRIQEAHAVIIHILCDLVEQVVCKDQEAGVKSAHSEQTSTG